MSDDYRYYEAITHPTLSAHKNCKKVLVIGGGNGMIASELLKYPEIEDIFVLDTNEFIYDLHTNDENKCKLNNHSLSDGRITKKIDSYQKYIEETEDKFDVIILDYGSPDTEEWSDLYSLEFYQGVKSLFTDKESIFVTSASSPTTNPKTFWCILQTMLEAGVYVSPYHQFIGSMGDCGFNIGGNRPFKVAENFPVPTKSLNKAVIQSMLVFGPDQYAHEVEVNTKENRKAYEYYTSR